MQSFHATWLTLCGLTLLGACTTAPTAMSSSDTTSAAVTQAAATPLSDLNLVRAEIPPVLRSAQTAPYAAPAAPGCQVLAQEIEALDAVLGPDLDAPASAANPSLIERGTAGAGHAAVGALRDAAEGVVPFRGWVRKLTGAERYSREVAAAIAAGTIRRAFLKGLGQAADCPRQARPRTPTREESR